MAFWRAVPLGMSVSVKVQPAARRAGILGTVPDTTGTRLKIAEPPEDGRANWAACAALAACLDVLPSAVTVLQGAGTRQKTLLVSGDATALATRLAAL